ncbi:hypothetical protein CW304_32855 [Bacillus sp. UFRGS-B20]|nr:hypothetical protein CW304_32855 [Bacillus sp. UFRGS-B20]
MRKGLIVRGPPSRAGPRRQLPVCPMGPRKYPAERLPMPSDNPGPLPPGRVIAPGFRTALRRTPNGEVLTDKGQSACLLRG